MTGAVGGSVTDRLSSLVDEPRGVETPFTLIVRGLTGELGHWCSGE